MRRELGWTLAVYAPHLLEEALAGMEHDPVVAPALAALGSLSREKAIYLVFQLTLLLGLALAYAVARGGAMGRLALAALSVALLAEGHHLLRAAWTHNYNPGLLTAWPMPLVGGWLAMQLRRGALSLPNLQGVES